MRGIGLKGSGGERWAYLYANKPKKASYVPKAGLRDQEPAGKPRIKRKKRGVYRVKLPNMAKGGAAQVTAATGGQQRCNLGSISSRKPQVVVVRCFSGNGRRSADAAFSLAYER